MPACQRFSPPESPPERSIGASACKPGAPAPALLRRFAEEDFAMATSMQKLTRRLTKEARSPKIQYLLLTTGAAFLAERLARTAITQGWRFALGEEPPRNPERLDVTWSQALGWTAITGL